MHLNSTRGLIALICCLAMAACSDDSDSPPQGDAGAPSQDADAGRKAEELWHGQLPSELVVHPSGLYFNHEGGWSTAGYYTGAIRRIPAGGGPVTLMADEQAIPFGLVGNQDSLLWRTYHQAGGGTDGIIRLSTSGGMVSSLYENAQIMILTVNSTDAFATAEGQSGEEIWRVPLNGQVPTIIAAESTGEIAAIAADDQSVYWTVWPDSNGQGPSTLKKAAISGGPPAVLASGLKAPGWLVVDGKDVYWGSSDKTISSVSASGGEVKVLATDTGMPGRLVVDDTSVFWISYMFAQQDGGDVKVCGLKKVAKAGGTAEELVRVTRVAIGLAVDATHAYWTEWPSEHAVFEDGWIMRVVK